MKIKEKFVVIDSKDNVATARTEVSEGLTFITDEGSNIEVKCYIPFGHKIALKDIAKGEPVIKYGQRIGIATQDIKVGELVHTHNLSGERGMAK